MKIVVGLGNPGKKYVNTRHNIGFDAVDALASKHNIKFNKEKFNAIFGEGNICGEKVLIVKPQTFMNLSGEAVRDIVSWFKEKPDNVLVIFDDISLPVGKLRIRPKGSAGGHNGIKSIIYQLGSDTFPRIKIGVGSPQNKDYDLADFVLGKFSKDETAVLIKSVVRVTDAVEDIIINGTEHAMNIYNAELKE